MSIYISIVVCTYNRCESLKDTLDSLMRQECNSSFDYEVIVVDNNSSDNTKEVVERHVRQFNGRLRYVFEPKQGVSHARNRGVDESRGEVVVFTDDDCLPEKKWLVNTQETFKKYNADCIGGCIAPIWEIEKPKWLNNKFYGKLALLDHGEQLFQISESKYKCHTANLAFTKKIFNKYGPFQTNVGRKGDRLFGGEDIAFIDMLFENMAKIIYQPNMIVYHKISKERLTKKFFRKWHFDTGIASAYTDGLDRAKRVFFDIPRYKIGLFLENLGKYILLLGKPDYFYHECMLILYCSYFSEKIKKGIGLSK